MPLRTLLPSAPGLGLSHRRHSSIVEDAPSPSTLHAPLARTRTRGNSLKRLSLSLSRTNEEPFPAFLTAEADRLPRQRPSTQPGAAPEPVQLPKDVGGSTASLDEKDGEEQRNGPQDELGDLPLPTRQRLSLLGMRHASDPQLSTRYRSEEPHAPRDVARMYSYQADIVVLAKVPHVQPPKSLLPHPQQTRWTSLRKDHPNANCSPEPRAPSERARASNGRYWTLSKAPALKTLQPEMLPRQNRGSPGIPHRSNVCPGSRPCIEQWRHRHMATTRHRH
jgi:hypothetical protein